MSDGVSMTFFSGLQYNGLLDKVRAFPKPFIGEFKRGEIKPLTCYEIDAIVNVKLSEDGSNNRTSENEVAMNWSRFLERVQGMLIFK